MAFGKQATIAAKNNQSSNVDWDALNKYVVETAGLEERETLMGVVVGIVGLGTQEQDDGYRELSAGESEEEILKKFPGNYFKTEGGKRFVCWKVKPVPSVAIVVDFPQIQLDKGKFFGSEDGPKPLRMILGGEFTLSGGMRVVSHPLNLRYTKELGTQSLSPKNTLYKMARADKLVKEKEPFTADRLYELLGTAFQFSVQVYMKDGKYMTEYCKFVSGIGRGQTAPAVNKEDLFSVEFDEENKEEHLKSLRASIRNSMMLSPQYGLEEFSIKSQLEKVFPDMKDKWEALNRKDESKGDEGLGEDCGGIEGFSDEEEEGIPLSEEPEIDDLDNDEPY